MTGYQHAAAIVLGAVALFGAMVVRIDPEKLVALK